jgi:hypothetical protein
MANHLILFDAENNTACRCSIRIHNTELPIRSGLGHNTAAYSSTSGGGSGGD